MSDIWTPGESGVKIMLRPTGRQVYAPREAFDVDPVEPRATDREGHEREERDAWNAVVYKIANHHHIPVEQAEALARDAREKELARRRATGTDKWES